MAKTKEEKAAYMKIYNLANKEALAKTKALWREKNLETVKKHAALWRKENPESVYKANLKWRKQNPDKVKSYLQKNNTKLKEELKDGYVSAVLKIQGFKTEQITPELIELKRITLKTKRLCRQLKA